MGIICCLYSNACLPEFLLGVIDLGNSELLNVVLGEAGAEAGGCPRRHFHRRWWPVAAGDGDAGGGAVPAENVFPTFESAPSVLEMHGLLGAPLTVGGWGRFLA